MTFRVFEDNGGRYHWTIIAAGGESLVRSASFASYEDARQAARVVHVGADSASFEHLADAPRAVPQVDPAAHHRSSLLADDLEEGGSMSSEAVTR
jgi:uncharacterized protein YegP (UPF0339 family)